ncbi:ABC transporter substrate-binding protein [Aliagarivorans marinus]|uniref:ABC transporter substrate-binding protein n=1 Tax=Aliagarivorans marinus TaxID=561965 RepID=UPI000423957E|nr:ABC transporter substrate-binding protein [Aliagarivorans marinus]
MKRVLSSLLGGAALLSASMLAQAETTKLTLMLDWFVNPNHGPLVIAEQRGYFADQDLEIVMQEPADPSMPAKLVAAKRTDLAVTYQTSLAIDVAADLPLVVASTLIATPLNTLTVLEKSGIKTMADLKGKKIGIAIAGNEEATLGTMLERNGVAFDEVQLINVGWALSSSLASGKVDGIWGGLRNFESNQLELEGYAAKAFFPEEHGVPAYDELIIVANRDEYNHDAMARFNQAVELAVQYIVNHPEEAWQQFVAYAPDTLDTELNRMAWEDTLTRFALRPAAQDFGRYQQFSEFMFEKGVIAKPVATELFFPAAKD